MKLKNAGHFNALIKLNAHFNYIETLVFIIHCRNDYSRLVTIVGKRLGRAKYKSVIKV